MSEELSPRWAHPNTVAGFTSGGPNEVLIAFAQRMLGRLASSPRRAGASGLTAVPSCLDIGAGAARNAVPLADLGFRVTAADLSAPMLDGARARMEVFEQRPPVDLIQAPMAPLPFAPACFDLVVAHGIWNLAHSDAEFRTAVAEAARVARSGAGLFLFTFSRRTLPPDAIPDPGQSFTFSCWNGEPQCFLTEVEAIAELSAAGFERDGDGPLTEYNAPRPGEIRMGGGPPVIFEGTFTRR